jgi:hypothetical protein
MDGSPVALLDSYRIDAQLSNGELWLRYFELGGMSTGVDLEAFLLGILEPSTHDHDVIAHALVNASSRWVATTLCPTWRTSSMCRATEEYHSDDRRA